ncbi:PLP-dependent aminotransferase family protein [Alteribacter keqinensis]|uniref:PLP-dependent aminotransferase family protein n=1 Tax=Alteribacter keqinensis TaxID=2483800 RepID=A0A3M7TXL8_9BACI|nr:PLP-dependent aminotransferase family protein [Alteribacter keqinensis]RNA70019.1 PLP-dependent aminotransferase family protein [Alteribacter keqinensis]
MIFLNVDKTKNTKYIYQQIYQALKKAITANELAENHKLPSKRTLAVQLQVSVNSVSTAYEQLLAEGYIYTIERKGYYVEKLNTFIHTQRPEEFPDNLRETPVHKDGWLSFSHMTSDVSMFPFKEWVKCQNKAIRNHKHEFSEIMNLQGPYLVRETIARMIALTRGVVCEPEQIVIGGGTQALIRQFMTLQDKNTKVAIENPGYSRIHELLTSMKFDVASISLDKKGIDINEIHDANPNILFITPSHQFPTGKIMPISRRIELLNWAASANDRYIVEDDYDSEFKYGTDNIPSLQSLDRNQRVIYAGTFSKTLLPSLRISYIVLPPKLLKAYRKYFANWIQESNTFSLYTLHYFIKDGNYDRHIKRMTHHYELKRKDLINKLKDIFGKEIVIEDIPAGLHFLAHFRTHRKYEEIHERAKKEKLEVYSIKRFTLKQLENHNHNNTISLVLGFATIPPQDISEAVERLFRVIN